MSRGGWVLYEDSPGGAQYRVWEDDDSETEEAQGDAIDEFEEDLAATKKAKEKKQQEWQDEHFLSNEECQALLDGKPFLWDSKGAVRLLSDAEVKTIKENEVKSGGSQGS